MITYHVERYIGGRRNANKTGRFYKEGTCLSTDTKPLNLDNGSSLRELDTCTLYFWDLENKVWRVWK